jgi:hopanoid biosynthesis associated protein HpnK
VKKLIVNADDFGLTEEINHGIIQAHKKGILTSTSLVAAGEAFDEAVTLARQHPTLDVGVHLTLVEERSISERSRVPTLVNSDGYFRKSAFSFLRDYVLNRIDMSEVRLELTAQIKKINDSGVPVSHLDSHQHIHILPKILRIVLQLAQDFHIEKIRAPFEQPKWQYFLSVRKWPRLVQQLVFNLSLSNARYLLRSYSPVHFFGFFYGGHLSATRLARIISCLPMGVSEVMCHPGLGGGRSSEKYGHWQYDWWNECCALMNESILDLVREKRVVLSSFRGVHEIDNTNCFERAEMK